MINLTDINTPPISKNITDNDGLNNVKTMVFFADIPLSRSFDVREMGQHFQLPKIGKT